MLEFSCQFTYRWNQVLPMESSISNDDFGVIKARRHELSATEKKRGTGVSGLNAASHEIDRRNLLC